MHEFHVTVFCQDGTKIEWYATYGHSIDATMDAWRRVGGVVKVKVVPM